LPFLGSAISFGSDAIGYINQCRSVHGEAFTMVVGGSKMTMITDVSAFPTYFKSVKSLQFTPVTCEIVANAWGSTVSNLEHLMIHTEHSLHRLGVQKLQNSDAVEKLAHQMEIALDDVFEESIMKNEVSSSSSPSEVVVPMFQTICWCIFKATTMVHFGPQFATDEDFKEFVAFDKAFAMIVAGVPTSAKRFIVFFFL
jgi:hypothetical protein